MQGRNWTILIAVNVVISAAVVFGILVATGRVSLGRPAPTEPTAPSPTASLADATPLGPAEPEEVLDDPQGSGNAVPTPFVHVVQEGDTLSGIALKYGVGLDELIAANELVNPDLLRLGQEIMVPSLGSGLPTMTPVPDATAEPIATDSMEPSAPEPAEVGTPVPTPTTSGPPLIEIAQVLGSSILGEEIVVIRNRGGAASLQGWTLAGGPGRSFGFPALTLYTDAEVRLHSKTGTSGPSDLYWGLVEPAWHAGELITLRDARDEVIDTYIVP